MEVVRRAHSMKEISRQARTRGRRVGFVPTMGALHEGHLSLVRRTRELTDLVVVSIFVNPTQFGPQEDFATYPRDLMADVDLCVAEKVDYVFAPPVDEIFPPDAETFVDVTQVSLDYEGESRPGHFRGVATVVLKLLNTVMPDVAAFGQKDAQQVAVIRRMVRDLMLDVEILVLPTVRDEDGLALSSRNRHLTAEQRACALAIPRSLEATRSEFEQGQRDAGKLVAAARETLEAQEGLAIDYLALVDAVGFRPVDRVTGAACLVVAARVGDVRLLDNLALQG